MRKLLLMEYNEPIKRPQNQIQAGNINPVQDIDQNTHKKESTEVWLKMLTNEIATISGDMSITPKKNATDMGDTKNLTDRT